MIDAARKISRNLAIDLAVGWHGTKNSNILFNLADGTRGVVTTRTATTDKHAALTERLSRTRFLLISSGGYDTLHHINFWYEFCLQVDPALIVVVSSYRLYRRILKQQPGMNVVYINKSRQFEWFVGHAPGLVACLYPDSGGRSVNFLRFGQYRHIFLGHGDSEKAANCNKFFRSFDAVWVAGQAQIDRFINSGINFASLEFKIVGRPLTRPLIHNDATTRHGKFLYLPTWGGITCEQDYSSVGLLEGSLPELARLTERCGVVKYHPFTKDHPTSIGQTGAPQANDEDSATDAPKHDIQIVERHVASTRVMADVDFLIADVSSVVSDFLITGRPIFLYLPDNGTIRRASSSVPMHQYCYVFSTPAQLRTLVEQVIVNGDDYLHDSRQAARNYFVDIERTRNHEFERALQALT